MTPRVLLRLVLATALGGSLAAQATVFKGPQGGTGDVWVYPALGAAAIRPPELQGIVLLPVDAAGRSALTQFQPDQPRLKSDLPLASRVVLPGQKGVLYRYRRARTGGADFGYFVVGPNGLAEALVTFPGTGVDGLGDPIPNPVAISAAGDAFLAATTPAAGGDLFEVSVAGASAHLLTGSLAPLDFQPQGAVLLPSFGAAVSRTGAVRFARGGTAALVRMEPPWRRASLTANVPVQPLTYFGNGIVRSADGRTLAVIAGVAADQAHVFTFGERGGAVAVNDTPAPIADPGFGTQASPTLALAPDGSRAAWKTRALTGEIYSRSVSRVPVPGELHVTGDQDFDDTLNDTGVISFFDTNKLVLLVGEGNGVGGVEGADLYVADFAGGGTSTALTNLSATSGDAAAPFLEKGDLETSDGIYQVPGRLQFVYHVDRSSGQGSVYHLDGVTGQIDELRAGIERLDWIEAAGTSFYAGLWHDQPSRRELIEIPFDHALPTRSLGFFDLSQTFARVAGSAGTFAGILNVGTSQRLGQLSTTSGAAALLPAASTFGPVLGFDGAGAVLASVQTSQRTHFVSWSLGGLLDLYGSAPVGLVLPGN